jgi:hypothetical protein
MAWWVCQGLAVGGGLLGVFVLWAPLTFTRATSSGTSVLTRYGVLGWQEVSEIYSDGRPAGLAALADPDALWVTAGLTLAIVWFAVVRPVRRMIALLVIPNSPVGR